MSMTRSELRAAILAADDLVVESVPTPEWPGIDGHVFVRKMSLSQRERYLASIRQIEGEGVDMKVTALLDDANPKLAAATMCTEKGETLFDQADVNALGEKSYVALGRVIDVAARLNELDEAAGKRAKNELARAQVSALSTV